MVGITTACATGLCGSGIRTVPSMVSQHGSASPHLGLPGRTWRLGACSLPCLWLVLAVDWDLRWGLFLPPGFLTIWWLVSKVSIPRERHVLWTCLGIHRHFIVLTEVVSFRERNRLHLLKEECWHYAEGRTCGDGFILVHSSLKNTTGHKNLDVEMITRKMPSIGLRRLQGSWPSIWTRKRISY